MLGDNLVVLPDQVVTHGRIDRLALAPRHNYQARLAAGVGYDAEHRTLLGLLQAEQAGMRNRPAATGSPRSTHPASGFRELSATTTRASP